MECLIISSFTIIIILLFYLFTNYLENYRLVSVIKHRILIVLLQISQRFFFVNER